MSEVSEVLQLVEARLRSALGEPGARAAVTFLGAERIEVLRFHDGDVVRYATLGMSAQPMTDPAAALADPVRGPRAELLLTVRAGQANSHKGKGWEKFTDTVLKKVNEKEQTVVFLLWGGYAAKKIPLIDESRHVVIKSAHPSPLSAHNGFFGSKPFSRIDTWLAAHGEQTVPWGRPAAQSRLE